MDPRTLSKAFLRCAILPPLLSFSLLACRAESALATLSASFRSGAGKSASLASSIPVGRSESIIHKVSANLSDEKRQVQTVMIVFFCGTIYYSRITYE